jgi:hypothetical protein
MPRAGAEGGQVAAAHKTPPTNPKLDEHISKFQLTQQSAHEQWATHPGLLLGTGLIWYIPKNAVAIISLALVAHC